MLRNTSTRPLVVAGLATATLVGAAAAETKPQTVYVIPITGQMGTDIHASIYEDIIKDVKEVRPDIVIFRLKSADVDTNDHIQNDDRRESGFWEQLEGYRDLMLDIKDGLSEAGVEDGDQIMWIEDCVGPATLLAMSWPNIYMTEGARLQGFDAVQRFADGWSRGSASRPASRRPAASRSRSRRP
jgi:hypothetical protein